MTWNLPVGETFLPHVSTAQIKQEAAHEQNSKARVRLMVALRRKQGDPIDAIADALGLSRSTTQGILYRFRDRGLDGAHAVKQPGRPRRLSQRNLNQLRDRLLKSPRESGFRESFWTTRMILRLVQREHRATYTREHMTRLLCKLGFSYKKPRATNPRRATDKQVAEFKKKRAARCWLPDAKNELFS